MSKLAPALATTALACFAAAAFAQASPPLEVRKEMIDAINPAALAIWDVTNAAADDDGALDPARLTADSWGRLKESAEMLEIHGRRMAEAQAIVAGGPDLVGGELPPGVASREEIQGKIDADPATFRRIGGEMAGQARTLVTAVDARDARKTGEVASGIDGACQACHEQYWYPSDG
jgi:hypothetical protein